MSFQPMPMYGPTLCVYVPNQNPRPSSSLLRNWKLHTSWIRRKFQERNFFSSLTSRTSTPSLYLKLDDDGKLWIVGGCWIMRAPNSVWSEEKNTFAVITWFCYVLIILLDHKKVRFSHLFQMCSKLWWNLDDSQIWLLR